MAEIKIISENRLRYLAGEKGLNLIYLEKDYFLTLLLYLIRDVGGLCFKGGTALNKIFLEHARLSEDLDFSCTGDAGEVKRHIIEVLGENKKIFPGHEFDNEGEDFFRMIVLYRSFFSGKDRIVLDVNMKASVIHEPREQKVPHFYEEIPEFGVKTLDIDELFAEKVRALITLNQPRDYFDVYMLLENGYKIDFDMVKAKVEDANEAFDVGRVFKNAQKIYSKWDVDIGQLTNRPVDFLTVMKRLNGEFIGKHF